MGLNPELAGIAEELEAARARAHALADSVTEAEWQARPDETRWSMAECVGHLNLTSEAMLPLIAAAIEEGARLPPTRGHHRRDMVGWLMSRMLEPPVRFSRTRTPAAFVPMGASTKGPVLADFDRFQSDMQACLRSANGLNLAKLWVTSPFNPKVRYNLYSAFCILTAHQRRHLWQAEQVRSVILAT